jgi:hypothetical protein
VRLVLDNHYAAVVAARLRNAGFEVSTAHELQSSDFDDEQLLEHCAGSGHALLTSNAVDFVPIARMWQAQGLAHAGLVLTSDATFPRHRAAVGALIGAIAALMSAHPADNALADRVIWLVR